MKKYFTAAAFAFITIIFYSFSDHKEAGNSNLKPDPENAGLKLQPGFVASTIIENTGRPRHLAVTKQGAIYVKLQRLVDGKGILFLEDTDKDGKFTVKSSFGNYPGTGITLKNGYLYASSDQEVFRYKLNDREEVIDPINPEKIITGLKAGKQHQTKSIVLDNEDHIYVNIGAYSNACQEQDRGLGSKGMLNCPILDSAGGIWQFNISRLNQSYAEGERYATGLRNVMGLDWNKQNNTLYVMQHGRDNLNSSWPELYNEKQSADLPAEAMYMIRKGNHAGWPYMYYDHLQKKKILAPEYGGDGKKEDGKEFVNPINCFPGTYGPQWITFLYWQYVLGKI